MAVFRNAIFLYFDNLIWNIIKFIGILELLLLKITLSLMWVLLAFPQQLY